MLTSDPPVPPGRLPVVGHGLSMLRDPLGFLGGLHRHGPVVRIQAGTKTFYVVTSPELVRELLVKHSATCIRAGVQQVIADNFGNGLVASEGDVHRCRRRSLQPGFTARGIETYLPAMAEIARERADGWSEGQPLKLADEFHDLAFSIVAGTLFGTRLTRRTEASFRIALARGVRGIMLRAMVPRVLLLPENSLFTGAVRTIHALTDELANRIENSAGDGKRIYHLLSRDRDGAGQDVRQALREEVTSLMGAGTDTVAVTLGWFFHELNRRPDVEAAVRREVEAWDGEFTSAGLAQLTYTHSVIQETLRLHVPVSFLTRQAEADTELGGYRIPAGSEILFSLTALHRHPGIFPDPLRFDPGRWLPENVTEEAREAFMPFGVGKHRCLGEPFAWAELLITAVTVLSRWSLVPHETNRPREVVLATVQPRGLVMTPVRIEAPVKH